MNRQDWLDNLQVGDTVCVESISSWGSAIYYGIYEIKGITPTRRFKVGFKDSPQVVDVYLSTGYGYGDTRGHIKPITEEVLKHIEVSKIYSSVTSQMRTFEINKRCAEFQKGSDDIINALKELDKALIKINMEVGDGK